MADFAANTGLMRNDGFLGIHLDGAGGMAGEAAQHRSGGIEDAVADAGGVLVTRREGEAVDAAKPALAEFEIVFRIGAADESDGLEAGAEGPFTGLWRLGALQRVGMSTRRLSGVFAGMTRPASRRARIIGRGGRSQQVRNQKSDK